MHLFDKNDFLDELRGKKELLGRIEALEKRLAKLERRKTREPGKTKIASPNKLYTEIGSGQSRYRAHELPGIIECNTMEGNLAIPIKKFTVLIGYTVADLFIEEDDGGEEHYIGHTMSVKLRRYLK